MSDDREKLEINEEAAYLARKLSSYAKVALVALVVVYVSWVIAGGIDAQLVAMSDTSLNDAIEDLAKNIANGNTKTDMQGIWMQMFQTIAPRMHWFTDALISSVVAFAFVGWLVGRWTPNPSWAGLLPVADLLSGLNPATLGDGIYIDKLPLEQQFCILSAQCIVCHLVAYKVFERRVKKIQQEVKDIEKQKKDKE